jgi:hypothetical protein
MMVLKLVWAAATYFACAEWMSLFAHGAYAAEVHTGRELRTIWLGDSRD